MGSEMCIRDRKKYRLGIVGATGAVGQEIISLLEKREFPVSEACLLYTSDAADDTPCVDLGGRRIIKKKKQPTTP